MQKNFEVKFEIRNFIERMNLEKETGLETTRENEFDQSPNFESISRSDLPAVFALNQLITYLIAAPPPAAPPPAVLPLVLWRIKSNS